MATRVDRARRRRHGLATYRVVRYADDFVVMVCGTRQHAEAIREQIIPVLTSVGLRLSEEKTTIAHLDEGFEFLGFRIQRQTQRDSHRRYVYTWVAKRSLNSIKTKVKTITRQGTNNPLKDLLRQLNPVLRGWTNYFQHAVAKQTFSYLQAYTWRRVIGWLRRKYHRTNWKQIRRHLGGWWPQDEGTALFDTRTVPVTPLPLPRRGHPHALDPTTGDHAGRLTLASPRGEPDAVEVARPVRGAGRGNGPAETLDTAPRPDSTTPSETNSATRSRCSTPSTWSGSAPRWSTRSAAGSSSNSSVTAAANPTRCIGSATRCAPAPIS